MSPSSPLDVIRSPLLEGSLHGFLGRRGGLSTGPIWGLNAGLGSGDDPELVHANRRLALESVAPGAQLVSVYQVHSADAVCVTMPYPLDSRPKADALVTDRPSLALAVVTADCAPVLFADRNAGVVAAAHAGWKGAFSGILEATLKSMESLGASRDSVTAAIGPTIARRSYEVDEAFLRRFTQADEANERFFTEGRTGHYLFDLEAFLLSRLAAAGVTRVQAMGLDTYANAERFYSYRRATHLGKPDYGRQISIIALPA
jgi:polyphenol oxidase